MVVGAGGAGSVVAARLSEEANVTVALLEAGDHETELSQVPGMVGDLQLSEMDWQYRSHPSTTTCLGMKDSRSVQCVISLFASLTYTFFSPLRQTSCPLLIVIYLTDYRCNLPRGRVVGGSSSINYMLYVRGNRHDYDHWEALGNPGWGFLDVLPFFMKSEGNTDPTADASRCLYRCTWSLVLERWRIWGRQVLWLNCMFSDAV